MARVRVGCDKQVRLATAEDEGLCGWAGYVKVEDALLETLEVRCERCETAHNVKTSPRLFQVMPVDELPADSRAPFRLTGVRRARGDTDGAQATGSGTRITY